VVDGKSRGTCLITSWIFAWSKVSPPRLFINYRGEIVNIYCGGIRHTDQVIKLNIASEGY
jgi:hypothetical protein